MSRPTSTLVEIVLATLWLGGTILFASVVAPAVEPRADALARISAPSLTTTGPVKLFAVPSVSEPGPDFTRPVVPASPPLPVSE